MRPPQRPFFIGVLSNLVVDRTFVKFGLSKDAQRFDRAAYERSQPPAVPAFAGQGVVRQDLSVPTADGSNAARLYTPTAALPGPLVVCIHGGGWVLNTARQQPYDSLSATISRELGCCVLSLDYRLAPEHAWPVAVEDIYAALVWLASADAAAVAPGADRERVVLMGESAGGNLAACASLMWRDRRPPGLTIAHQVLLSPCVPTRPLLPSRTDPARAEAAILPAWLIDWMEAAYAGEGGVEALSREPYANPLAATRLDGLPPLSGARTGVVGGAEVLRDEGVALFEAVRAAGGDAAWREYAGAFHAFVVFPFGDAPDAWRFVFGRLRSAPGLFEPRPPEATARGGQGGGEGGGQGGGQRGQAALLLSAQKLTRDVERATFRALARSPLVAAAGALVALALCAAAVASFLTGETFGTADFWDRSLADGIDVSTSGARVLY